GPGASINGTSSIALAPNSETGQATLRLSNGGSVTTAGALVVGDKRDAWVHLRTNSNLSTGSAVLGVNATGNGQALIQSGSGSGWTNTGALVVGAAGTGLLIVENN